ncbi:MAG: glutamate 5-kinase [Bdellovibrionales bacterium]
MRRWVVKAGSKMVCDGGPLLMRTWMQQVAELRRRHRIEVIWVSSGAIAWAIRRTDYRGGRKTLPQKQALSAIGQPLIMDQYGIALQSMGLLGAQVLLTGDDMRSAVRRRNLQNTLTELLRWKAIPILNENDAVATTEIQFGDNDALAAQVAQMMRAERLVLMTDVEGFFDADPSRHSKATLVPYRRRILPEDLKVARTRSSSGVGTGGMYSKLLAADRASRSGIVTHLVKGDRPRNLLDLAAGRSVGTQVGGKSLWPA